MTAQTLQKELDAIINVVKLSSEAVSIEELLKTIAIPRRTLQRRLALLVKTGSLQVEGKSRGQRYRFAVSESKETIIPLSLVAKSIQALISQPVQTRPHVSYNREFLDKYRPNITHYLPVETQQKLLEWGKPSDSKRPAGTYARQIFNRLLIDLSWNSSRLEGNTYSLLETERLLKLGEASEGKDIKEAQMILNHKAAIEFLVESAEETEINRYTILNLHALLSNNLLPDPRASGRLRTIPVGIAKSAYHPLEVPQLIHECFNQILDTAKAIKSPFEQAFFLMVHLPYLQPFEDVNKRVSRLAANIPLIHHNLCPLSFVDVPEAAYISSLLAVYELNRIELLAEVFIWAYKRSCSLYSATRQSLGEPDPFRMRYRELILEAVLHVVRERMNRETATASIKHLAETSVPLEEQSHFIEVAEIEVMGLHEGNIARYRLRPSEYDAWQKIWG